MREKIVPVLLSVSTVAALSACSGEKQESGSDTTVAMSDAMSTTMVESTVAVTPLQEHEETLALETTTTTTPYTTTTTTTIMAPMPSTTTTEAPPSWFDTHELPEEAYESGARLGVLRVVNSDGEQLVNIPLFSLQEVSNSGSYNEQLERGAVLEVAHPDINPDVIRADHGVAQTALLGETGTAVIPAHRMSWITPDWLGIEPENVIEQRVFERIDELEIGAVAVISLDSAFGSKTYFYEFLGNSIVEDVMDENNLYIPENLLRARTGPTDQELIRLFACTPKGSLRDRILSDFIRITETKKITSASDLTNTPVID